MAMTFAETVLNAYHRVCRERRLREDEENMSFLDQPPTGPARGPAPEDDGEDDDLLTNADSPTPEGSDAEGYAVFRMLSAEDTDEIDALIEALEYPSQAALEKALGVAVEGLWVESIDADGDLEIVDNTPDSAEEATIYPILVVDSTTPPEAGAPLPVRVIAQEGAVDVGADAAYMTLADYDQNFPNPRETDNVAAEVAGLPPTKAPPLVSDLIEAAMILATVANGETPDTQEVQDAVQTVDEAWEAIKQSLSHLLATEPEEDSDNDGEEEEPTDGDTPSPADHEPPSLGGFDDDEEEVRVQ